MPESQPERFKIGELIKRSGFNRQQIQNFIVMGLLREEDQTESGQRLFGATAVKRLAMIRGLLKQGYNLGEIPRTYKRFLKVLVLGAGLFWALSLARPAPALAAAGRTGADLAAEDRAGLIGVFEEFSNAVKRGAAAPVGELLAPSVPAERRRRVLEKIEADLGSRNYREFKCAFDPAASVELPAPDRVRLRAVITHEFEEKSRPGDWKLDAVGQEFTFELVKADGRWRIESDDYFDTLAAAQSDIFSRLFLWTAAGLAAISFWTWMFLDACFRTWTGRKRFWISALLVGLAAGGGALAGSRALGTSWLAVAAAAPALTAAAYFLGVWMRQERED